MATDHGDLAARYRRDGYLVVPALLTSGEVEEIRGEIALICRGARGEVKGVTAVAAEEPDEAVVARYLCIDQPHKASPFLSSYLAHPPIVEVLRALIGPNVKCMQTVLFTRPAQELGMSWHQDERYIPTRDRSLTQTWIALDDTTRENGCLRVIPGSHAPGVLWPTRPRAEPDSEFNAGVVETYDFPYADDDAAYLEVSAGSAIFFNGYLLHGSQRNRARRGFRRALAFTYM